jgi:hypothetical protein
MIVLVDTNAVFDVIGKRQPEEFMARFHPL